MSSTPPPIPPPIVDYQGPHPNEPRRREPGTVKRYFLGLVGGCIASALVWIAGGRFFFGDKGGTGLLIALAVVPGLKVAAFIWLMFLPRLRSLAAGILTSVAIGAMIFFGACAANLLK